MRLARKGNERKLSLSSLRPTQLRDFHVPFPCGCLSGYGADVCQIVSEDDWINLPEYQADDDTESEGKCHIDYPVPVPRSLGVHREQKKCHESNACAVHYRNKGEEQCPDKQPDFYEYHTLNN